jgi:hypothetical protein
MRRKGVIMYNRLFIFSIHNVDTDDEKIQIVLIIIGIFFCIYRDYFLSS